MNEPGMLRALTLMGNRHLPPEDWCDEVQRLARERGMSVSWHQEIHHGRHHVGPTRSWALIVTRRGTFEINPAEGGWRQAFLNAGLEVPPLG